MYLRTPICPPTPLMYLPDLQHKLLLLLLSPTHRLLSPRIIPASRYTQYSAHFPNLKLRAVYINKFIFEVLRKWPRLCLIFPSPSLNPRSLSSASSALHPPASSSPYQETLLQHLTCTPASTTINSHDKYPNLPLPPRSSHSLKKTSPLES